MSEVPGRRTSRWTTGPPLIVGLVLLWLLLWRSVAPLTVVTGFVTALVVVRVFDLPPVPHIGRFRPWPALVLAVWFAWQVLVASVQVARQAFGSLGPARGPVSGIVRVQLRTRDDLLLSLTGIVMALIPGTVVVEVDRGRSVLYLHALDAGSPDRVEAVREEALAAERRLVRAFGSPGEREAAR